MEILRKRRASSELESLMSAVRNDYERFASFDAIFMEPSYRAAKRSRSLSDNTTYDGLDQWQSTAAKKTIRNIWNDHQNTSSKTDDVNVAKRLPPRRVSCAARLNLPMKTTAQNSGVVPRFTRIGFESPPPISHDSAEESVHTPSPPTMMGNPEPGYGNKIDTAKLPRQPKRSAAAAFHEEMEALWDVPSMVSRWHGNNSDNEREKSRSTQKRKAPQSSTKIIYGEMGGKDAIVYEAAYLATENAKEFGSRKALTNEETSSKTKPARPKNFIVPSAKNNTLNFWAKRHHGAQPINARSTQQRPIVIEDDDQVITSPTNEKEAIVRRPSPEGVRLSGSPEFWPNYVITKVGSLLWLDKEIVYPITLEEIRRRVQAPENFSFQMLIAYVRTSRAKGRQFLDYWNCQPTGKESRPNVLSKLCEADAQELVKGIKKVNEEYFPAEKLAKNAAENVLEEVQKKKDDTSLSQEVYIKENVQKIEKSRYVLRTLEKALAASQYDEKFANFNIASHNAGLVNLKYNLNFLGAILEKVQSNLRSGHRSLASLTG